ncbi:class I SAM-dependent methyltransferase [Streptomyces sp. SID3343]|uniref:class I SAM-dependent methyltransferase n=1 Tax=Streptomyces sp. SID3343 TaxID=2690260 RepID=UPI00136CDE26|nr:class I SAM-dependent methyltransferase [Streptomyces sp. SID3343]MYW03389.1 methyltransferase domain-containing protein [Streptomyces sp. SID3343]
MNPTTAAPSPAPGARRSARYDAFHAARARTDAVARLYAAAMGDDYPHEIAASSSCDWPLLGLLTARLRMRPGRLLVDAGCGTGGIGLWLARALAVRLEGFDLSPVAVTQATGRRAHFLDGDIGRAAFRVAELEDTGLPDSSAHGIVCVDALGRATDRDAAVRELGRVLAPGARLVMTRSLRRGAQGAWDAQARAAGLTVEHVDERPTEPTMWDRLYRLWIAHADDLRQELGEVRTQDMLREAHRVLPTLPGRRAVLLTLRRPNTPDTADAAGRMPGPGRRPGDELPGERTLQ